MALAASAATLFQSDKSLTFTSSHPEHHHIRAQGRTRGSLDLSTDLDNLDDFSLENDIISPLSHDDRRESIANSTPIMFSPQSASWDDYATSATMDRKHNLSGEPLFVPNNNPFTRLEQPHIASYGHQSSWSTNQRNLNPRAVFERTAHDGYSEEYEPVSAFMPSATSVPMFDPRPGMPGMSNLQPNTMFQGQHEVGNSVVQSPIQERWMPDETDIQQKPENRFPRRLNGHQHHHNGVRPHSPNHVGTPGFINPSGVRKKNARFEIPQERNLTTIDTMIAEASDEELIKELKAQKRLLRNRQAALDSRQRKKKHTEELEREKEEWRDNMTKLENEVRTLRLQADQHYHERSQWEETMYNAQQNIDALICDKEELLSRHIRETGELRKKVSILMAQLQSATPLGSSTISPTSTAGYHDFTNEMNSLTMETDNWNSFVEEDEVIDEKLHHHRPEKQLIVASRPKQNTNLVGNDKSLASGVMYTILLFGAWIIASKSGDKVLPVSEVPGDVKAASAAVISNVFNTDVGSASKFPPTTISASHGAASRRAADMEPGPSVMPWPPVPKTTVSGAELRSMTNRAHGHGVDALEQMHHDLTTPSFEQEAEQLFSLSAEQYNALTSTDFTGRSPNEEAANDVEGSFMVPHDTPLSMTDDDDHLAGSSCNHQRTAPPVGGPVLGGRKGLARSLQNLRAEAVSSSTADVYTRSLWDRIPAHVVQDFRRMVMASEKVDSAAPPARMSASANVQTQNRGDVKNEI